MEGMLCRWALAMQEYSFRVVYRKGSSNANGDALSCIPSLPFSAAFALPHFSTTDLLTAQGSDKIIVEVVRAHSENDSPPRTPEWRQYPLRRYPQMWRQLRVISGVLFGHYVPSPMLDAVTVPILPDCMKQQALTCNHDAPTVGHQGSERTLQWLRQEAWDVVQYCQQCTKCQQSKSSMPERAPLTNVPKMVAVDILEVPISSNNNRYLLVMQDYFHSHA